MFNLANFVVFSLLSLGLGYSLGSAKQFGFFKFVILAIFIIPSIFLTVRNDAYIIAMAGAFVFGVLYAHNYLFDDFFDGVVELATLPKRRKQQREYARRRLEEETRYRAEQDQRSRENEQRRRTEEARRQRDEEARRQQEAEQRAEQEKRQKSEKRQSDQTEEARKRQEEARRAEQARKQREQQNKTKNEETVDKRTPEEVLGLKPGYTFEELKRRYKEESQRTHSDKWITKPEHIRKLMEEEQKRINWAFEQLKKKF